MYITQYLPPATARRIKNHLLIYDPVIAAYYRFTDKNFDRDEYRFGFAELGANATKAVDYIPNDICPPILDHTRVLNVTEDYITYPVTFGDEWLPLQERYGYSASIWLTIGDDSCYVSQPTRAKS